MTTDATFSTNIARTPYEKELRQHWDSKQHDDVNLLLGELDGLYHHHFGYGDYDPAVLLGEGQQREQKMIAELHRLESDQVSLILDVLGDIGPEHCVMDAGSGRGGTSFMIHDRYGCAIDGVNFSQYQIAFAEQLAEQRHCADRVRFHYQNMAATTFPDGHFHRVISNETTMYGDLYEFFSEFSRVLTPGGRYVAVTWCRDDAVEFSSPDVEQIDQHYVCHVHRRSTYFKALAAAGLAPIHVEDFTEQALPYWELREQSSLATGVEQPYLSAYRAGHMNYLLIVADRVVPDQPSSRPLRNPKGNNE
ncbi:methyltransferase domain-containing protein [Nocardia brasiliensis]|uniref:Type 11 methyltransferase n=1 Tax=Nocardia brasiliensis (strain ATCC 700358 / HUJEG-1) TaxID=1133849 RepID=K0F0F1_NOCB7|nr:methyltransferase domain-containing protein [Nocardia brasiliensis]AFU01156.1 type 11 methyltransferase [Nocardia brasiliensis ATCC 700358]OCF84345.1 SAM-dependent methyltransferase [Nocardia brasiliensis]